MEADNPAAPTADLPSRADRDPDELFARYAQRLTRLAEPYLGRRVAIRVEGEDVVQSVFRTFFRRNAEGQFRIDSSGELWRLLVTITLRKVYAKVRHHTCSPRDIGREAGGDQVALAQALSQEPGPEESAILADQIEALVKGFPPLHREVLASRLQGCTVGEIAAAQGVTRRTVERALQRLRERLGRTPAD